MERLPLETSHAFYQVDLNLIVRNFLIQGGFFFLLAIENKKRIGRRPIAHELALLRTNNLPIHCFLTSNEKTGLLLGPPDPLFVFDFRT